MKDTRILMDMPITVEITDTQATQESIDDIYNYFHEIDDRFSTFKNDSEISRLNHGAITPDQISQDMKTILRLCDETKRQTNGYFNIYHNGINDPSGLVKGWAIYQAALRLKQKGFTDYYVDAGGDIQTSGKPWKIGIRNPFNRDENVKVVILRNKGIATSGTSIRGQHIYNPFKAQEAITDIVSLSVIAPNIYEADRFATAAFAMGLKGIEFIERLPGFEGYMIKNDSTAVYTSHFDMYL